MTGPGDEIAAGAGGSLPECHDEHEHRDQVIRTLKAAVVQGRLTEDEYDSRAALEPLKLTELRFPCVTRVGRHQDVRA